MIKLKELITRRNLSQDFRIKATIDNQIIRTVRWERFLLNYFPVMQKLSKNAKINESLGFCEFISPPHGRIKVYPMIDRLFLPLKSEWHDDANKWLRQNVSAEFESYPMWVDVNEFVALYSDRSQPKTPANGN